MNEFPEGHFFPTRHGNWHVIDGKLVDVPLDEQPTADVTDTEHPADAGDNGGSPPHKPHTRRYSPEG